MQRMYTIDQAVSMLNTSREVVIEMLQDGRLKHQRFGKDIIRITESEVLKQSNRK
jgi:excisionase family DNA binding protein